MTMAAGLPLPRLSCGHFAYGPFDDCAAGEVSAWTDEALFDACGVRIAFTERSGGCSSEPYHSLNLKYELGDERSCVARNRAALFSALGLNTSEITVVSPRQVHKTNITEICEPRDVAQVRNVTNAHSSGDCAPSWLEASDLYEPGEAQDGSDAVLVSLKRSAALLCFADCLPLILVAPTGAFCVVHCGWKGTIAHLAVKATRRLAAVAACDPASLNAYIGAYIHGECFEVDDELGRRFSQEFSTEASYLDVTTSRWHVDLGVCVRHDLLGCGLDAARIADIDKCTACNNDTFFSYRAQDGTCGRHGAFAIRL